MIFCISSAPTQHQASTQQTYMSQTVPQQTQYLPQQPQQIDPFASSSPFVTTAVQNPVQQKPSSETQHRASTHQTYTPQTVQQQTQYLNPFSSPSPFVTTSVQNTVQQKPSSETVDLFAEFDTLAFRDGV